MDLVIGATGLLGGEICRQLRASGRDVTALVRTSSSQDRVATLEQLGVSRALGDLKDPASLRAICAGADSVIVTASSTLSRAPGDTIESVDRRGLSALIDAARSAEIKRFVFVSFAPIALEFPLQDAKRQIERELIASGIDYTILQPPHFFEVWFSRDLGFDPAARQARLFGEGTGKMNFVSYLDVARVASSVVSSAAATRRVLTFGGPAAVSQRDVLARFEALVGGEFKREVVPVEGLRQQLTAADPLAASFAGLMLACALDVGQPIDNTDLRDVLEYAPISAEAFARGVLSAQGASIHPSS